MAYVNIWDVLFPVGSFLMTDGYSPAEIVGGVWQRIEDANLYATNDDTVKIIGSKTISAQQMPTHYHTYRNYWTLNKGASGVAVRVVSANDNASDPSIGDIRTYPVGGGKSIFHTHIASPFGCVWGKIYAGGDSACILV